MTDKKININFKTNETKYYLLTEGSGYPLADFTLSCFSGNAGTRLVIPESIPKTSNIIPGTDES
ncbi:MAG: hypothetical protein A4E55_00467 [Pelotomaculum sp. PtaU1.Bin035]|nr:MAG: hypothetical protein A4E55_00467 [Pelotomaculum sp. PtaU1.Bin035]